MPEKHVLLHQSLSSINSICLIACVLFFLPYIKLDKGLLDQFDDAVDILGNYNPVVDQTSGIRVKDLRGMSTFRLACVVYTLDRADGTGAAIFDIIVFALFIVSILLGIVFANAGHPLLVISSGAFMAVGNLVIQALAKERFINTDAYGIPVHIYRLSIACYGYYVCAIVLIALGICFFNETRKLRSGVITEGASGAGLHDSVSEFAEKFRLKFRAKASGGSGADSKPKPGHGEYPTIKCTYCGKENDINNKFCVYCGKSLMPDTDGPKGGRPRVCPNGHIYYDPRLTVCPECGMPFSGGPTPPGSEKPEDANWMRPPRDDDLNPKH